MSTITLNKKPFAANWQTEKVQEVNLKSVAALYASLGPILDNQNNEVLAQIKQAVLINKAYYAGLPIKTPIELVKAIAEYSVNVLGIKVAIVEDSAKPAIVFEGETLVSKLVAINKVPAAEVQPIIDFFKAGIVELGKQFNFQTEITTADPDFIVTFTQ